MGEAMTPGTTTTTGRRRLRTASAVIALLAFTATACVSQIPVRTYPPRTEVALPTSCPTGGGPVTPPTGLFADGRPSELFAPANYRPGTAYPLLVSLHPFILDPYSWEPYSGLAAAASARGYWVLVPAGSEPGPRWAVPGGLDTGPDDVGWIDRLIQETANLVCVDPHRVFAAGFSAGAAMSVGLSCELPWRFRAIAGSGGSNLTSLCPDSGPTDALILHGTADPIAPPSGNTIPFTPPVNLSVDSVIANFGRRNGCDPTPTVSNPTASVVRDRYSCGSHRLEYWRMIGAGHTWSGAKFPLELVAGPTDRSFSATTTVLDFFDAS